MCTFISEIKMITVIFIIVVIVVRLKFSHAEKLHVLLLLIIIIVIKMLACKHCLSFACKRSSKVHPASQRALVGQMRLLFSWKSIWKPCSLSAVTPNVHHACLYRVQQVLPRHVSSADSQLWWSQTKHIVTLPITRLLYCNLSHHLSSAL